MAKKEKGTGFFAEFKKFITRGNVLDMAVGVIVGGAFTGIVNGLSNYILKPIINWLLALLLGDNGLESAVTILSPAYQVGEDGSYILNELGAPIIDLANSIYIDWGSFISAIINFLLIAFVLFIIVRTLNNIASAKAEALNGMDIDRKAKKEVKKIRKEQKISKIEAEAVYLKRIEDARAAAAEAERLAAEKAAEEVRLAEEKANLPVKLLAEIRDLLQQKDASEGENS